MNAIRSRPKMQDYGIEQGDEGMIEWDWVQGQLEKSRNYWICTVKLDHTPHAAPVWGVWLDGALYFGSDPKALKSRNMIASPEVVMHLESGDETVIIEGQAQKFTDAAQMQKVFKAYQEKYDLDLSESSEDALYFEIKPRVVLAWLESDFPHTATRWQFS